MFPVFYFVNRKMPAPLIRQKSTEQAQRLAVRRFSPFDREILETLRFFDLRPFLCVSAPQYEGAHCASDPLRRGAPCISDPQHKGVHCISDPQHEGVPCASAPQHKGVHCIFDPLHKGVHCISDPLRRGAPCVSDPLREGAPCTPDPLREGAPCTPDPLRRGAPCVSDPLREGAHCASDPLRRGAPCVSDPLREGVPCASDLFAWPRYSRMIFSALISEKPIWSSVSMVIIPISKNPLCVNQRWRHGVAKRPHRGCFPCSFVCAYFRKILFVSA